MDVWEQVTPEAPSVTVLKRIGHPPAKGHGKRERLILACHPALCELCVMENIQGHWAGGHTAVEEGCCRCRKGTGSTAFNQSLMRSSTFPSITSLIHPEKHEKYFNTLIKKFLSRFMWF